MQLWSIERLCSGFMLHFSALPARARVAERSVAAVRCRWSPAQIPCATKFLLLRTFWLRLRSHLFNQNAPKKKLKIKEQKLRHRRDLNWRRLTTDGRLRPLGHDGYDVTGQTDRPAGRVCPRSARAKKDPCYNAPTWSMADLTVRPGFLNNTVHLFCSAPVF